MQFESDALIIATLNDDPAALLGPHTHACIRPDALDAPTVDNTTLLELCIMSEAVNIIDALGLAIIPADCNTSRETVVSNDTLRCLLVAAEHSSLTVIQGTIRLLLSIGYSAELLLSHHDELGNNCLHIIGSRWDFTPDALVAVTGIFGGFDSQNAVAAALTQTNKSGRIPGDPGPATVHAIIATSTNHVQSSLRISPTRATSEEHSHWVRAAGSGSEDCGSQHRHSSPSNCGDALGEWIYRMPQSLSREASTAGLSPSPIRTSIKPEETSAPDDTSSSSDFLHQFLNSRPKVSRSARANDLIESARAALLGCPSIPRPKGAETCLVVERIVDDCMELPSLKLSDENPHLNAVMLVVQHLAASLKPSSAVLTSDERHKKFLRFDNLLFLLHSMAEEPIFTSSLEL